MNKIDIELLKKILIQQSSTVIGLIALGASIYTLLWQFKEFAEFEIILGILGAVVGVLVAYFMVLVKQATNTPKIYISYAHEDKDIAEKIYKELNLNPFVVLMDKYDIRVGDNIPNKLKEMLKESDYMLFISSKKSSGSEWANVEIDEAKNMDKKIFPIKVDESALPSLLKDTMYANFSESFESGMNELVKALKSRRKKVKNSEVNNL